MEIIILLTDINSTVEVSQIEMVLYYINIDQNAINVYIVKEG